MKVLLIAPFYDRQIPGESWSTYKWVQGISERCETTVLTTHRPGWNGQESPTAAVETVNWPDPALPRFLSRLNRELKPTYLLFYFRARRWLKEQIRKGRKFDLIHQINPLALRYPCPATGLGIPYVIGPLAGSVPTPAEFATECPDRQLYRKLRGLDAWRFKWDPWLRSSYEGAVLFLGVAPYVRDLLGSIQLKRFECLAETGVEKVESVPKSPPAQGEALRLLYVGRVIRTKGVIDAIRAVAIASKSCHLTFDIVGDGDHLSECKAEAARLGIDSMVTFHGRLPRNQIDSWYLKSHGFLFPSFREPSGNVVFEALGFGCPVIACREGGPGYVVDSSCGISVELTTPQRYVEEIAAAIKRLHDDSRLFAEMSKGALVRIEALGGWERKLNRLLEEYAVTLAENRAWS